MSFTETIGARLRGTAMPRRDLPASDGSLVALDRLGPGRTVIYAYPLAAGPGVEVPEGWDAIPGARGCTPEACGFRDQLVQRLALPYPVLSDLGLALAAALDLATFTAGGAAPL